MLMLTAATHRELEAALRFSGPLPPLRQAVPESRCIAGRDCVLLLTGVGLVNAAWALGRAAQLPGLSGVVNLGVAGSFDPDRFPLGRAAVVRREIWPEYGLQTGNTADAHGLGFAQHAAAGPDQVPVWNQVDLRPEEDAHRMGLHLEDLPGAVSLSVGTVTATAERARSLQQGYGADMENMEGFALAYGCLCAELPFVELRCVSNRVGSRRRKDWDMAGALDGLGRAVAGLLG
jgi:futalosine hydrolase